MPRKKPQAEKRRWQRIALTMPVFVRGIDESGKEFLDFSTVLNMSRGGALLLTQRPLPPSAHVSLQIPQSPIPTAVLPQPVVPEIGARVVNVRPAQDAAFHLCGLSFSHPLPPA